MLYFDISENGSKPASPAAVINGRFEQSTGSTPDGWIRSAVDAGGNQNNEVYRTSAGSSINLAGGCSSDGVNALDTSPNSLPGGTTGEAWHLLGYRDNCEDGAGSERIRLSRNIQIPTGGSAGFLEFYFQVQSFDGIASNSNYDWFSIYVNGSTLDHRDLGISSGNNPRLRIDRTRFGRSGFGNTVNDFGWKRARLDLSAYAGSSINFRIESRHSASDNSYRSWIKIDDVVWSQQNATLGIAQAFGVNVTLPADTAIAAVTELAAGAVLQIAANSDASALSVTADVLDPGDVLVASGIVLFDDGSHGDAAAGDGIWTNDGSDPAFPTYTFAASDPVGAGWLVRVSARDSSVAGDSNSDGLLLRPGEPATPEIAASYFNIDEQSFTVGGAAVSLDKVARAMKDPVGGSQPKLLPGAWVSYQVTVTNLGPDSAENVSLVDNLPEQVAVCVVPACTCVGTGCTQLDPVDYDDSASPILVGLGFDYSGDVSYSLDGVDFSHTPIPDGEGFAPDIRYIRVTPTGTFNGPVGTDSAQFILRYVVRLD
jgi:uncharacterized repeat protein (TIGR01451 family)